MGRNRLRLAAVAGLLAAAAGLAVVAVNSRRPSSGGGGIPTEDGPGALPAPPVNSAVAPGGAGGGSLSARTDSVVPDPGDLRKGSSSSCEALRAEAADVAARLVRVYPDCAQAIAVSAMVHDRFRNTTEAAKCWRRCLKLDPTFAEAHHGLGSIALKLGRYEEAEEEFRRAIELKPRLSEAYVRLAESLMNRGKMREAAAALRTHAGLCANTSESCYYLGQAYLYLKEFGQAQASYEAAVRLDPACTYAYHGLAAVASRLGEKDKAGRYRAEFQRLKEKDQAAEKARMRAYDDLAAFRAGVALILTAAGQVYRSRGDALETEDHWRRAAEYDPRNAACREQLAALYQESGRLPETLAALEQLAEIEPHNPVYRVGAGVFERPLGASRRCREVVPESGGASPGPARRIRRPGPAFAANQPQSLRRPSVRSDRGPPRPHGRERCPAGCRMPAGRRHPGRRAAMDRAIEKDPANSQYRRIRKSLEEKSP